MITLNVIVIVLRILAGYLAIGLVVSPFLQVRALKMRGLSGSIGFRLVTLPGFVLIWQIVLARMRLRPANVDAEAEIHAASLLRVAHWIGIVFILLLVPFVLYFTLLSRFSMAHNVEKTEFRNAEIRKGE